jgi:hypothetical protein
MALSRASGAHAPAIHNGRQRRGITAGGRSSVANSLERAVHLCGGS